MKKKGICIAVLTVALLLFWAFLVGRGGDVSHVTRNIGESTYHTEKEIGKAMDAVETYFKRNFEGCTLLEITYDAKLRPQEMEWEETYGVDSVIVLTSGFYVSPNGGDGSLNRDYTYKNWKWIMASDGLGTWRHRNHGYG